SAHLPLDLHPQVGNNAQLAAVLGLTSNQPFFEEKGQLVGVKACVSLRRDQLDRKLQKGLSGPVKAFMFGPKKTGTIGIITGGAGSGIYKVAQEGGDTLITRDR